MKKLSASIKRRILLTCLLLLLFCGYTAAVLLADVQPVGPQGSLVGFSTVNVFFFEAIGTNHTLKVITDLLGIFAIASGSMFALFGAYQWFSRKSLRKVDPELFVLGTCYILLGVLYYGFEKIALNYRPILEDGELAASYPSSHTLLVLTVMGSVVIMANRYFRSRPAIRRTMIAVSALVALTAFFGRMFSGIHWYTDIIGGLLLAAALVAALDTAFACIAERREKKEQTPAQE